MSRKIHLAVERRGNAGFGTSCPNAPTRSPDALAPLDASRGAVSGAAVAELISRVAELLGTIAVVPESVEPRLPFRWDLVAPDQLGSMLVGTTEPDLWFIGDLVECAGQVLARSGNGDLLFVGRSLDSMFDFLSGALAGISTEQRLARLPFSFARRAVLTERGRWRVPALSTEEQAAARRVLTNFGLTPHALARRTRPAVFVDVVSEGSTFTELFNLLADWITEARESWDVVKRKLRFVGVTRREKTSPKTWRWQQHTEWTRRLPAGAVANVSLDRLVWSYFGDHQTKLTRSFRPDRWLNQDDGPDRDDKARQALAEAVALVTYGHSTLGRHSLALATNGEPALAQPWLRSLVRQLNLGSRPASR